MKGLLALTGILAVTTAVYLSAVGFGQERAIKEAAAAKFVSIVLGTAGGLEEQNLSAYLLAPIGSKDFVALDAGTLLAGLRKARMMGSLWDIHVPPESDLTIEGWVLQNNIKAYLITHAHLAPPSCQSRIPGTAPQDLTGHSDIYSDAKLLRCISRRINDQSCNMVSSSAI